MKTKKISFRLIAICLLTVITASGCGPNQLAACQQENLELQKVIAQQQAQTTELQGNIDLLTDFLSLTGAELQNCQENLKKLKKQQKTANKAPKEISTMSAEKIRKGLEEIKRLREAKAKLMMEKQAQSQIEVTTKVITPDSNQPANQENK
jgi:hypothetical protein